MEIKRKESEKWKKKWNGRILFFFDLFDRFFFCRNYFVFVDIFIENWWHSSTNIQFERRKQRGPKVKEMVETFGSIRKKILIFCSKKGIFSFATSSTKKISKRSSCKLPTISTEPKDLHMELNFLLFRNWWMSEGLDRRLIFDWFDWFDWFDLFDLIELIDLIWLNWLNWFDCWFDWFER